MHKEGLIVMVFRRKIYDELLSWKAHDADQYALLIEGARRVGKSTIAEEFAQKEYRSYILIDFSKASQETKDCFDDLSNLDFFFLRLQAIAGITLYPRESLIIFDEVQLFPRAREAIKHLVKDGRYHFLETGSLISIKKNVSGILVPSEEISISMYPMDYEEFTWALGSDFSLLRQLDEHPGSITQSVHRKLMRDFRLYMAVGGMPQAVESYLKKENLAQIDKVKRNIIKLYEDDFRKIGPSGKISMLYHSIPAQLMRQSKKFYISRALGKKKNGSDSNLIYDLIDSKTVLPCYDTMDISSSLSQNRDLDSFKLYVGDIGLFVTLMFYDKPVAENDIYRKLLSDKLDANLGYLYENVVANMIASTKRELHYHTWEKEGSTHHYEIDFMFSQGNKLSIIEAKSSGLGKHESLIEFKQKYSKFVKNQYIVSQKPYAKIGEIVNIPVYLLPLYL